MNLQVFLSDFSNNNNCDLINTVYTKFEHGKFTLGYISSKTDSERRYYNKAKSNLNKFGNFVYTYYDMDKEYDSTQNDELFSSDVIYLSGGMTYYFLYCLKKRKVVEKLQNFVKRGGSIIGVSAGAIIMTEHINITKHEDIKNVSLKDLSSLGLVSFEFMPHWKKNFLYLDDLKEYSKDSGKTIYTCKDGDGITVENKVIKLHGDIKVIEKGIYY